MQQKHTQVLSF